MFEEVKLILRSKLAASKDEGDETLRTLRYVLASNIKTMTLYKVLENIHKYLPSNTRTGVDEQTGLSASQLTQPYFEIAVWMIGVDLQLPEMVTYGTKLAAHTCKASN